jgi:hypothetical protein
VAITVLFFVHFAVERGRHADTSRWFFRDSLVLLAIPALLAC